MQVEGAGSCRVGFGGAIRQFRNPTKSCVAGRLRKLERGTSLKALRRVWRFWRCQTAVSEPYKKQRPEGQGSQERAANAGGRRWKLQAEGQGSQERAANAGGKGYLSEGAAQGLKVLKVPNSSFGTLQKAKARRPREPGASSYCRWRKLERGTSLKALRRVWRFWRCQTAVSEPYKKQWPEGQGSQERAANAGGRRWKLQGRFWRCYPSVSEPYKKLCGWKAVSEPYKKQWPEGQGSQERAANAGESRWKLQARFWRCYPSVNPRKSCVAGRLRKLQRGTSWPRQCRCCRGCSEGKAPHPRWSQAPPCLG